MDRWLELKHREEAHTTEAGVRGLGWLQEEVTWPEVHLWTIFSFFSFLKNHPCSFQLCFPPSQWACSKSDGGAAGKLHRRQRLTSSGWCSQVSGALVSLSSHFGAQQQTYGRSTSSNTFSLLRCIVRALKDPNTFLMDHLLILKPVRFLEGELIHDVSTTLYFAVLSSAKLSWEFYSFFVLFCQFRMNCMYLINNDM